MSGAIVRYDKTHSSLEVGLAALAARAEALDLSAPGVEFAIQKMAAAAQTARDVAKDRHSREAALYALPLAEIRSRWRPVVDGFDALFRRLKEAGGQVLQRRREEEERLRREAETRLEEAKRREAESLKTEGTNAVERHDALMGLRQASVAVASLPPKGAPIGVTTDQGTLSGRETWAWEVEDLARVPDIYLQRYVDTKKVDLAVANGMRAIAGIRIFPKTEMRSVRPRGGRGR